MELYQDEREIDLKQMLWYLWDHKAIVFIVGVLLAGLAALYSFNSKSEVSTSIEGIIDTNKEADPAHIGNVFTTTFYDLPDGAYLIESNIEVEFNLDRIYSRDNASLSDAINIYKRDAAAVALQNSVLKQVIDELNLHQYQDMRIIEPRDLYYSLNAVCDTSGLLKIQMTDVDSERGRQIVDLLSKKFVENIFLLEAAEGAKIINNAEIIGGFKTSNGGDSGRLIYIILAFLGGIFIMSTIYVVIFILGDGVRTSAEVEKVGLSVLAMIPTNNKVRSEEVKRAAYSIGLLINKVTAIVPINEMNEEGELTKELCHELENIGKKPSIIEFKSNEFLDINANINKSLNDKDVVLVTTNGIVNSADAILASEVCKSVILIITYGKVRYSELVFAVKEIKKTGATINGVILTDVKHRG